MPEKVPIKVISRNDGSLYMDTIDAGEKCLGIMDDAVEHLGNFVSSSSKDVGTDVSVGVAPEDVYLSESK